MRVEIFQIVPDTDSFAPAGPLYSFLPQDADQGVFAAIETGAGWHLAGEPEPLLMRRTGVSSFLSRTATEAFYHAMMGVDGFAMVEAPPGMAEAVERARAILEAIPKDTPELPPPTHRNGKSIVPARRTRG